MKAKITNILMTPAFFWITGLIALVWVVLRSGTNPRRLTYPCQQAAYPLASAWVIAFIPILIRIFRLLLRNKMLLITVLASSAIAVFAYKNQHLFQPEKQAVTLPVWKNANSISDIYICEDIPVSRGSLADADETIPEEYLSDPAIDSLVYMMSYGKTPFFRTAKIPNGIVGKNDVVILKCNFQWRHRLGTNTDRIKGVIRQILNHPEGFNGEVLVCDNQESQIIPQNLAGGFNDTANNSDDEEQSVVDVINTFKAKNYPVDYVVWDSLNTKIVSEYSEGDLSDGYIFNKHNLTSYPKFQSPHGNYVSFSKGLWSEDLKTYDSDKLTIINFPVLKAHGMAGATIALKNYIGVMNTTKNEEWFGGIDNFHFNYCFTEYALVAKEIALAWPDLNIVDATYVATESNVDYTSETVYQKAVLASIDAVAASWYAAKYILTPLAKYPSRTDPDLENAGGDSYSTILDYWTQYLSSNTDIKFTKSKSEISVYDISNYSDINTSSAFKELTKNIKVFPNPFKNELIVYMNGLNDQRVKIRIIDIQGQVLKTMQEHQYQNKIHLSSNNLTPGTYIVELDFGNGMIEKRTIVKN